MKKYIILFLLALVGAYFLFNKPAPVTLGGLIIPQRDIIIAIDQTDPETNKSTTTIPVVRKKILYLSDEVEGATTYNGMEEIIEKRTPTNKYYDNGDGTFTAVITAYDELIKVGEDWRKIKEVKSTLEEYSTFMSTPDVSLAERLIGKTANAVDYTTDLYGTVGYNKLTTTNWNFIVASTTGNFTEANSFQAMSRLVGTTNRIIYRGLFRFDTSGLGADARVLSANTTLYATVRKGTQTRSYNIYNASSFTAVNNAEFDNAGYIPLAAPLAHASFATGTVTTFVGNQRMIANVSSTAYTYESIREATNDVTQTAPVADTVATYIYGNDGANLPTLIITYTTTFTKKAQVLAIGGGGGGGNGGSTGGYGGGGGGFFECRNWKIVNGSYPVTVGLGGATDSMGASSTFDYITAFGGSGATAGNIQPNGGSGAGAWGSNATQNYAGFGLQGFAGGNNFISTNRYTGGGGGCGSMGELQTNAATTSGADGGRGLYSNLGTTTLGYCGGGGGGAGAGTSIGGPGSEGGGNSASSAGAGTIPRAYSGGGGGGEYSSANGGKAGAKGMVVIRVLTADYNYTSGGNKFTDGDYTVHEFKNDGVFHASIASTTPPATTKIEPDDFIMVN